MGVDRTSATGGWPGRCCSGWARATPETAHHRTLRALARSPDRARRLPALGGVRRAAPSPAHRVRRRLPVRGGAGRRHGQGRCRAAGLARAGFRVRRGRHGHRACRSRATRGRGCSGCPRPRRSSTGWASTTPAPPRWPAGWPRLGPIGVPLGISLGKSKVTPVNEAVGDYLTSLRAVLPVRRLHRGQRVQPEHAGPARRCRTAAPLDELLGALTAEAGSLAWPHRGTARPVPVLVKIAPDLTDAGDRRPAGGVRGPRHRRGHRHQHHAVDRPGVAPADAAPAPRPGGLSGRAAARPGPGGGAVRRRRTATCR